MEHVLLAGVARHEGEEEGQVDQEGYEGVQGVRGAGRRIQGRTKLQDQSLSGAFFTIDFESTF